MNKLLFVFIMRLTLIAFLSTLLFLNSCKNLRKPEWSELPGVTNINKLQNTEFVPTLESNISNHKNSIYTASFLYAWDKIKQKLNLKLNVSDLNSIEFKLINQSTSYKNTLTDNEYTAEVEIVDSVIAARAFFNKTLPFPTILQKLQKPILFNKTNVSAFGMQPYNAEAAKFTEIMYYKDDDHFVLKLTPKDKAHQILLVKGISNVTNLIAAVKQTDELISAGNNERNLSKARWKYSLNEIDIFSIPVIKFNIDNNYTNIEGQAIITNNKKYYVATAYQRTGFILNENGAVVESQAYAVTDSSAAEPSKVLAKKMVFDKPFFIIVKRIKSDNPYFVMYVQNDELLTKE